MEQSITMEALDKMCPQKDFLPLANEKNEAAATVFIEADFNRDGIEDYLFGYRPPSIPSILRLFLVDGREGMPELSKYLLAEEAEAILDPNYFGDLSSKVVRLCVYDGNIYKVTVGKDEQFSSAALLNQLDTWQAAPFYPEFWTQPTIRRSVAQFKNDWEKFKKDIEEFSAKYDKEVSPELTVKGNNGETEWELKLVVTEKIFNPIPLPTTTTVIDVADFADPTLGKYEQDDLTGGKDIQRLLNEKLSPGEWNLMYRFNPGRNPILYQIAEVDSPIAFMFMHGATLVHDRKRFGLSLEYYYGELYLLPVDLSDVSSGDSVSELPFQQNIPLRVELHNFSVNALTHWTHFDSWGNIQATFGLGVFYESGTIFYSRYGIKIPPLRELTDITPTELETDEGQEKVLKRLKLTAKNEEATYNAGGLRLQFNPYYERDIFITGLNVVLDTGVPLNAHMFDRDRYAWRFLITANAGLRFTVPITR
ncbi:MAG: hypothetical protein Q7T03_10960 [Deltaproteobacteria bacterium]|nr:hypothetical protein [Deltaproteobacteria bacterium]